MPDLTASKFHLRTSNCRVFRRCLRKWGYQSSLRRNLSGKGTEQNINFWFGTAIHYAMEDYFGYNKFGDPREAFKAYYKAFPEVDRPMAAGDHYDLGISMLTYFLYWYPKHNLAYGFETVWVDDVTLQEVEPFSEGAHPLVEEEFTLDLGITVWVREDNEVIVDPEVDCEIVAKINDPGNSYLIVRMNGEENTVKLYPETMKYHGTCDRIVRDKKGRWWILDYKTAKGADTNKLDTDDQISRYLWAMELWFQRPIEGFIYLQLTKDVVQMPRRLKDGKLSVDKKQKTTSALLRVELEKDYGAVAKAPKAMIDFLNTLTAQETEEGDRFIRWDLVRRSKAQKESTYRHIMAEAKMMVNPNLYLYPSPTRDCIWECNFRDVCIMEDDGRQDEAERYLAEHYEQRAHSADGEMDAWRKNIKYPDKPFALDINKDIQLDEASEVLNIILPDEYK